MKIHPQKPIIEPCEGIYKDSVEVRIFDNTPGGVIHYTLDGSHPNHHSPVYHHHFVLTKDTVVKAVTTYKHRVSEVAKAVFAIENPYYHHKKEDVTVTVEWKE